MKGHVNSFLLIMEYLEYHKMWDVYSGQVVGEFRNKTNKSRNVEH